MSEWIKTRPTIVQVTPFQYKDSESLNVKGMERSTILTHQREAGGAALISDKADFRAREINDGRLLKGRQMLIKGSILQENTTILDGYALENKVLKHVGQNLLELPGGTDFSAMVVGTGTPFPSERDGANRRVREGTGARSRPSISWCKLTSTEYFLRQPQTAHASWALLTTADQILSHKAYLHRFKRMDIITSALSPQ